MVIHTRHIFWAGGLLLSVSAAGRGQQAPCSFPPCMTPIVAPASAPAATRVEAAQGRQPPPVYVPPQTQQPQPVIPPLGDEAPLGPRLEQDQAKLRNTDRQKRLIDDTQKLLSLATELKTEVDKSNKDMMSLDVIKKADEIEKLAHSVKEKMKGS